MIKVANVEFSGTPAALSPEAPLERRVMPAMTRRNENADFQVFSQGNGKCLYGS